MCVKASGAYQGQRTTVHLLVQSQPLGSRALLCVFGTGNCNTTSSRTVCWAVRLQGVSTSCGAAQAACAAPPIISPRQNTRAYGTSVAKLDVLFNLPPPSRQGWGRSRALVRSRASCTVLCRYEPSSTAHCPLLSHTYASAAGVWLPEPVKQASNASETTAQEQSSRNWPTEQPNTGAGLL